MNATFGSNRFLALLLFIILSSSLTDHHLFAATPISGSQSGTLALSKSPYLVTSDLYVPGGQTLMIEPGVVVQFQDPDTALIVDGTLTARGTPNAPITFTSEEAQKSPGQWEAIIFRGGSGTNSILEQCLVEYGAARGFSDEIIRLESASPTIRNCTISNSRWHGMNLIFSDARIENCRFLNNGVTNGAAFAMAMRSDSLPQLVNNTASGNGRDAIGVFGGDVNRSGSWGKDNLPYTLVQDTYIGGGRTLTIQPGVVVQFQNPDTALYVDGILLARGTGSAAIRFTSDEAQKAPGQWESIIFRAGSSTNSILENCIVEYGAAQGVSDEMIRAEGASPTIRNCTIGHSRMHGMTLFFSDLRIENCQFLNNGPTNNAAFAIAMRTDCLPELVNNTASGNGRDAIGVFGGDVNRSGSWGKDNLPYTVVQDTYVSGGRALTIQPGVVVQFLNPDTALLVDGALIARGTATAPITFTSDETQKAPGQWEAVIFRGGSGTNSIMENCVIEHGAASGFSDEMIRLEGSAPTFRNCTIRNSRLHGITLLLSDAHIENCRFQTNGWTNAAAFAIAMRTDSLPQLVNNTANGNGRDAIGVFGGDVNRSGSWGKDNLPYTLVQDTYIGGGRTLTIQPGVVVQFQNPDTALYVDGILLARGTGSAAIRFTSDEAQKAPGQWEAVIFRAGSSTNSILENCIVEYGAAQGVSDEMIRAEGASPTIRNCTIGHSRMHGMTLFFSDVRIENCQFLNNGPTNNAAFAIAMRADCLPEFVNNTASGNGRDAIGVFGGDVNRSGSWGKDNLPYTLVQDTYIAGGRTLTIQPGVVVQFQNPDTALYVDGALVARGTAGAAIRFTSDEAQKAPGQWEAIIFRGVSNANSVLENCLVEYGGANSEGAVALFSASPRITECTIQNSISDGIHANNSSPSITNSRITGNRRDGVRTVNVANPTISNSTITANTEFGVRNFDTSKIIIARSNYWGDPTGPLDTANTDGLNLTNSNSKGSKVSEFVNWGSFLGSDPVIAATFPGIEVSAPSLDFGSVTLGQIKDLVLTVRNTGTAALSVNSAASSNSRFAIAIPSLPFNIATGAQQVVTLRFTPNVAQAEAGTITLVSNDPNRPKVAVSLSGIGFATGSMTNCPALPAGLVAWWKAEGNGNDSQGTNHGILNGVTFVPGEVGHAFGFDGVTNYVGTSLDVQPSALPSTTWEAWVFPTQPGGRQQILSSDDAGYDRSVMVEGNGFGVFTGSGLWNPTNVTFSEWQHVAVVFTPANIEFYKNGVRSSYGFAPTGQATSFKLQIGRNPGFGEFFKGLVDEVSIYNRALTSDEIRAIYNAGSAGKCPVGRTPGGTAAPDIDVFPSSPSFGNVSIGQSGSLLVTIRNTGTNALIVNAVTSNNSVFRLIAPAIPLTVAAGAQQALTVVFAPTVLGNQSGTLSISSNDPDEGIVTVSLTGAGIEARPTTVLISDSFSRADADRCSLGKADLAFGGAGNHFYLPIFPAGGTDASRPIGANIVSGALQNNGLDFGGVQFVATEGACANLGLRGESVGQDINIKADLLVPTDAAGNISQAGPYLRSRGSAAGDGIIGGADFDPSSGYWVQLHSTGEIKVKRLNPIAIVAFSGLPASFNPNAVHTLEIAAQANLLQVALDGNLQTFSQDGKLVTAVAIPNTGSGNQGTAGIAFGAENNRGKVGGQRADNLMVTAFRSLEGFPAQNNFIGPPLLSIQQDQQANVVISWPATPTDFLLQSAEGLTVPIQWLTVTDRPLSIGGRLTITVSPGKRTQFYRLFSSTGTASPIPTSGEMPPPLQLPDDWRPSFPALASASATIPASTGGTIQLSGGVVLTIPAGALSEDTKITVTKLEISEFSPGVSRDVYRIDAGAIQLQKPATLVLPYNKLSPSTKPSSIHVLRTSSDEGTQELPAQVDEASSTVRVVTDHFSDFIVEQDSSYLDTFLKVGTAAGRILHVPYYPQGDTMWCFAASSQMMLKYYDVDVEAWNVARYFGLSLSESPAQWRLWVGNYTGMFQKFGVKVKETSGWALALNANGYLIQQIDAGRPVFVTLQNAIHAVVVVGYDSTGIYIHDPSGYAFEFISGQKQDEHRRATRKLSWDEWLTAMYGKQIGKTRIIFTAPFPVWTIVLDGPPAPPDPPLTVALISAIPLSETQAVRGFLEINRPLSARLPPQSHFLWDGRKGPGYRFVPDVTFVPANIANSDEMVLWVHLNNPLNTPASGTLRVTLDDRKIYQSPKPEIIPAATSLHQVILFDEKTPYRFKDALGGVLVPGPHLLLVELDSGGKRVDGFPIEFQIGPAKPAGLEKSKAADDVKLTWTANPEEKITDLLYDIYRDDTLIGATSRREYAVAAGSIDAKYTVVAHDIKVDLESPPSEPAKRLEATVFVRQAPSVLGDRDATSGGFPGSSPPVRITYSANSAEYPATMVSTRKSGVIQTDVMRITWTEPPAQVKVGDTINIVFTVESGNTPTADISRDYAGFLGTLPTLPPLLLADANAYVGDALEYSGPEVGFRSKDCKLVDTGTPSCTVCSILCYGFNKRSVTRTIKVEPNFTGVVIKVGVGKRGGNSDVATAAYISWEYKPQQ